MMLTLFFDHREPLLIDWLLQGITVNADHTGETLECFSNEVNSVRTTREKLQQFRWEILPHSPYSPDLSPCDYHVLGARIKALKGERFTVDADVQEAVT